MTAISLNKFKSCVEECSTLVELLRYRAEIQPNQKAYTFLQHGETEEVSFTYRELDLRARAIASHLQSLKGYGDVYDGLRLRALLLYPPGLEFIAAFFGCLYAGVVAVPVYPPKRNQSLSRFQSIVSDAQTRIALTVSSNLTQIQSQFAQEAEFDGIQLLATDTIPNSQASDWEPVQKMSRETLAFLQYTSGSTGTPKGVMVSHRNLLQNSKHMHQMWESSSESVMVTWLPVFHDMGLIYGVLQPLYQGFPCYMMAPASFIQKPMRWLEAISRYKATHSGAPNFAYELCVLKITPEERATLDLSSWQVSVNGAEPIRADTLKQFAQTFESCGFNPETFCPGYGLAEATLAVTAVKNRELANFYKVQAEALAKNQVIDAESDHKLQTFVGCGQTGIDTKVVIVHPELLTKCAPEEVGEIWISGSTVTQGYWQRPEETKKTFGAYLKDTKEGPFLRTGDLGFFKDNELLVTGRLKDVIIIRGQNYYPQDIEWTVSQSHPALRPSFGAAFTVEVNGEERLVVIQEVERTWRQKLDVEMVVKTIRKAISQEHELQIYAIVLLDTVSLPKTSSGKIQRSACRSAFLGNSLKVVHSWSESLLNQTSEQSEAKAQSFVEPVQTPQTSDPCIQTINTAVAQDTSKKTADNLIEWLRDYANKRINSQIIDERRCIPPHILLDFGNRGILGMQVSPEYGGIGLGSYDTMRIIEQLGAIDQTVASLVILHNSLGIRPILNYASNSVRDELLPILAKGRELAAFALTEPNAGSNPQAISSKAIPNANGEWLLQGTKIWSGSAAWAGVINVFVKHLDSNGKFRGISGFVVREGTEGLRSGPEALTMGLRGMVQNTVYLDDVAVDSEHLLGNLGEGMKVAQDAMMFTRLCLASLSVGGMKRCAQLILRYAQRRSISTGRLLDNPVTLMRLNDLTAATTAVETLVARIAKLLDNGNLIPPEIYAICKTTGPEFFWKAADNLMQLLGGRGYIETNIAPQILRDARIIRIFEGPTETLHTFVGSCAINNSVEIHKFLSNELTAPAISHRLRVAAEQINEHYAQAKSLFPDQISSIRWGYLLIGELASFAVLWAVTQQAFERSQSQRLRRAVEWTQLHFEQKLETALRGIPGESLLSGADDISQMISNYTEAIGDLEQTLAGEDRELDELLRQNRSTIISGQTSNNQIEISPLIETTKPVEAKSVETLVSLTYTVETIQNWIENWLSKRFQLDGKLENFSQSFTEYGIDSVTAAELSNDLEEWLCSAVKLEADIVWDFPTPEALAHHIARSLSILHASEN
ncbi:AMP-binding protein [Nostoc sp. NMS4]|uniref:AMP-binding protein n=1 Tax=Nostoc sp. NMS4 TaxID=2815390 RepID=UPI0025D9F883|nr:AMP-binding protein [Nostoc sp. NMS4]MBN3926842.1 AMP-binding protein [Nostoc sp. NMS4]